VDRLAPTDGGADAGQPKPSAGRAPKERESQ
jgi:hypothetical protein